MWQTDCLVNYSRPVAVFGVYRDDLIDNLLHDFPERFSTCVPHTTRPRRHRKRNPSPSPVILSIISSSSSQLPLPTSPSPSRSTSGYSTGHSLNNSQTETSQNGRCDFQTGRAESQNGRAESQNGRAESQTGRAESQTRRTEFQTGRSAASCNSTSNSLAPNAPPNLSKPHQRLQSTVSSSSACAVLGQDTHRSNTGDFLANNTNRLKNKRDSTPCTLDASP